MANAAHEWLGLCQTCYWEGKDRAFGQCPQLIETVPGRAMRRDAMKIARLQ